MISLLHLTNYEQPTVPQKSRTMTDDRALLKTCKGHQYQKVGRHYTPPDERTLHWQVQISWLWLVCWKHLGAAWVWDVRRWGSKPLAQHHQGYPPGSPGHSSRTQTRPLYEILFLCDGTPSDTLTMTGKNIKFKIYTTHQNLHTVISREIVVPLLGGG